MTKVNAMEMRTVNGGYTAYCSYCNKKFVDKKFLWWVYSTGQTQKKQHEQVCSLKNFYNNNKNKVGW